MSKVEKIFTHTFKSKILDSEGMCLVKFYSDYCHLCNGLEPIFEEMADIFDPDIKFYKVNTVIEKRLGNLFCKDGVPTLIMFHKGRPAELSWPRNPDPNSGFGREPLKKYLQKKISENVK